MIVRLIEVYASNIIFTLKIRLCLYKILINYLLSSCFYAIFHLYKTIFIFLI